MIVLFSVDLSTDLRSNLRPVDSDHVNVKWESVSEQLPDATAVVGTDITAIEFYRGEIDCGYYFFFGGGKKKAKSCFSSFGNFQGFLLV